MQNLEGSEKQKAWAESIIDEALKTCDLNINTASERMRKWPKVELYKEDFEIFTKIKDTLTEIFAKEKTAAEIIDKRDYYSGKNIIAVSEKIRQQNELKNIKG